MTEIELMRSYPIPLHPRCVIGWRIYGRGLYVIYHWATYVNCTLGLN